MKLDTCGISDDSWLDSAGISLGEWPRCNWKPENLVDMLTVYIIWKQIQGKI
jgi:hypothetical protein